MSQNTSGIWSILSHPRIYNYFQALMGANETAWRTFITSYIRPTKDIKILDIGCGPADILAYLPEAQYWGYDISQPYIDFAKKKYGNHGHFFCKYFTTEDLNTLPKFDVVLTSGVLHHMDDEIARETLRLAKSALRDNGRLVTIDPCYTPDQNPISRFIIKNDRGQNVRTPEEYLSLTSSIFDVVEGTVEHRRWIPYTHWIMECHA